MTCQLVSFYTFSYSILYFQYRIFLPSVVILSGGSSGQTQNGGTNLNQILMTTSTKSRKYKYIVGSHVSMINFTRLRSELSHLS
jgi:hypothetical protein